MRCPDPACATEIPAERWDVIELRETVEPWDGDGPDVFHWSTTCPGCSRRVAAWHPDNDAPNVEPPDGWCCPVCGSEAKVLGIDRGPCGAALRCLHGCGSLIAMTRLTERRNR